MAAKKKAALERAGWKVGDAGDLLGMPPHERHLLDLRLKVAPEVRRRREGLRLTQSDVAERLGSSQSRVAKIEAGDPRVSLDLLLAALFAVRADLGDVADLLRPRPKTARPPRPAKRTG